MRKSWQQSGTAITYKADVSDLNQVKQMVKDVSKELGGIDVLVNNAGIVRDEYASHAQQGYT